MLYGLLDLSLWGYVVATLIMTHITIAAVTIYLHRYSAHRALDIHPVITHFFRMWLWLTTGMVTKEWVAVHRKHHAFSEVEGDPHSPRLEGIKKVMWQGAELYRVATKDKETIEKYGAGTPNDWVERNIYTKYSKYGIFTMLGLDLIFFGVPGITVWAIQMLWIPFFAAGVINGLAHWFGYRNFECGDGARNLVPWGILIGGEELHNNHHAFGNSAKLSVKWYEFDIGWFYIRVMSLLGLAKVKRLPAEFTSKPGRAIDAETVKALMNNRLRLLARYSKQVVMPVLKAEKQKATSKAMFHRAKQLLTANEFIIETKNDEAALNKLLESNEMLAKIYQYRKQLQAIWERKAGDSKEGVEKLQAWCQQAEEAGIDCLKQFAQHLRTIVPSPKPVS